MLKLKQSFKKRLKEAFVFFVPLCLFLTQQPLHAEPEMVKAPEALFTSTSQPSPRTISLSAAFNQADTSNKEILVATTTLSIAKAAIIIAKSIPNPTYSLVYGFGPAWEYIVAGNNQQFGFSEELLVAGKRTKRTEVANANVYQIAFQIQATRFSVHNRMRRAYAELAAANAYAELTEGQRKTAEQLLSVAEKQVAAGKAPGSEVVQAELNVMQFETQRNQAKGRLIQDSTQLAMLLGENPYQQEIIQVDKNLLFNLEAGKNVMVPDPASPPPSLNQLLPAAWRERNDLKAAIQQAYSNRKSVTLAKSLRVPDPTIGFSYMFTTYKKYQTQYFDPAGTGQNTSDNQVPQQPGYLLTYQQEVPLFYQYQGQIKQARATLNQQNKQNELTATQIAVDIVSAYESLIVTRDNIFKYQQRLLPAASKVAQLSRRGYELGKTDLATAILAQQQYQQLRSSYFDSIVGYQNAWADLEKAVGAPLKI